MHSGWGVLVTISWEHKSFEVLERTRIETIDPQQPGAMQPYHYLAQYPSTNPEGSQISRAGRGDGSFAVHRELNRSSDKAFLVGSFMQSLRLLHVATGCNQDLRLKRNGNKLSTSVACFLHHTSRIVRIRKHHHACICTKVQIPKLVAAGERRDQQLLRIPTRAITPKRRIRRSQDRSLSRNRHLIRAFIVTVTARSAAGIARPCSRDRIAMLPRHSKILAASIANSPAVTRKPSPLDGCPLFALGAYTG